MEKVTIPGLDLFRDDSIKVETYRIPELANTLYISLSGYLDTYNSTSFQKQLQKVIDADYFRIIFDCARVNYVSSTGIGCFTAILKLCRQKKGDLVFLNIRKEIAEIFQLLGFSQFFVTKVDLQDALNYLSAPHSTGDFNEPKVIRCPNCKKPLKTLRPGRFRCSACKFAFTITEYGDAVL